MHVRTRPKDNARVIVTEAQARLLSEEWLKLTGQCDAYGVDLVAQPEDEFLNL
jgi:hypothetical protein